MNYYEVPPQKVPVTEFDVVVAGGGTGGVVAAIAAAREGVKTVLIESKGYPGGLITEGGTALHSFYNLWKAFPGVEKRQVVKGIPQEIIDRLITNGGTYGHEEMEEGYNYDSVCTNIDTEIYKYTVFEMLREAGVYIYVNTLLTDAIMEGSRIKGVVVESHQGREVFLAKTFIDCTGYGDLCARAGAKYTEPNDYSVANSIGVSGVSMQKYMQALKDNGGLHQYCIAKNSKEGTVIRVEGDFGKINQDFNEEAKKIGMASAVTSMYDNYFMFLKLNYKMPASPTNRDETSNAELELRRRQIRAVELLRKYMPGCENAFITRTSPSLCIRRARCIVCDYDISLKDITEGRHFEDDIMSYGFHDCAPRIKVKDGGTYGIPLKALTVSGVDNLLAAGMLITSNWEAHMSTRNTVSCMGQGQGAGTAAALCAKQNIGIRELSINTLKKTLENNGVYLESFYN